MTTTLDVTVKGMTCGGCARGIRMGLLGLPEVETVDVDITAGSVHVSGHALDAERLRRQLLWLGFPPTSEETTDADRGGC